MQEVQWLTAKEVLKVNAAKWPNKIGSKDLYREFTFKEWNERSCRLANALADMGMKKGDRFAALAYNCAEWMDLSPLPQKAGSSSYPSCSDSPALRWNIEPVWKNWTVA